MNYRAGFAALVAALAVAGCGGTTVTGSGAGGPAPVLSDRWGVNAVAMWSLPAVALDGEAAGMQRAGVAQARVDLPWQRVEPRRGTLDFSQVDAIVGALARHGITMHPIVDYSTTWGSRIAYDQLALPRDIPAFARFAAAAVRRYGSNGTYWRAPGAPPARPMTRWEVWNEPNLRAFSHDGPDPAYYARVLEAAAKAIRAADPRAQVVSGGLAVVARDDPAGLTPSTFLSRVMVARPELRHLVDAVALHTYQQTTAGVRASLQQVRATLRRLGMGGRPIELNEWGSSTEDTGITEGERTPRIALIARSLAREHCDLRFVAPFLWSAGAWPAHEYRSGFALSAEGRLLPAGKAYVEAAANDSRRGRCGG